MSILDRKNLAQHGDGQYQNFRQGTKLVDSRKTRLCKASMD